MTKQYHQCLEDALQEFELAIDDGDIRGAQEIFMEIEEFHSPDQDTVDELLAQLDVYSYDEL